MIRIITDSASDITQIEAKQLGIDVIPLKTRFLNVEYKDGVDITIDEFYNKLIESDDLPTTSCPSPSEYEELFAKYKDDDIVYISLSSKLSGTYQSAFIGKGDRENIYIVDSLNVSPGQRILVYMAIDYVKKGLNAKEIYEAINKDVENVKVIAMLDTLEYLKKGGRISPSAAAIGSLLGIKPVVSLNEGEIVVLGKARGSKKGHNFINEMVEANNGIDFDKPYFTAYAGNDRSLLDKYLLDSMYLYEGKQAPKVNKIGSSIGTHVGPGTVALAFVKNK